MTNETKRESVFWSDLQRELSQVRESAAWGWISAGVWLRNQLRLLRRQRLDYVVMPVGGSLPERAAPPRSFIERQLPLPSPPLSLETLNRRLAVIADADNVRGVLFIFRGFETGLASLQNFRAAVQRLRAAGKQTVVFTPYLNMSHYFAATAADLIVIPPGAQFEVVGLRTEVLFLKEALNEVGVQADVVQISPYKTALNSLSQPEMTPEQREQLNWLLDEQYDLLTAAIAEGRGQTQAAIQQLIDQAPLTAEEACRAGLVDHVGYEDELAFLLAEIPPAGQTTAESETAEQDDAHPAPANRPRAHLQPWDKAYRLMLEKPRQHTRRFIGVVSLEGAITMGPSRQPPVDLPIPFVGGQLAGEATLVRLLREAETMDNMAALIFHVDSGGGSALASDLIGRQIKRIGRKKPVLVYMGNVAASGGYYVSAAAQHIMCQPYTITGSIGVITARLSTQGLYQKLRLNRVSLERGKRAGLYSDERPMSEEERQLFWEAIVDLYGQFKQVVANGRNLPLEELDPVCAGRVWSGRQALAHKLVDSFGDLRDAVDKAAELAGLPRDERHIITVANLHVKDHGYVPPQPFETVAEIARLLFGGELQELNGRPLLLMPYEIQFK